MISLSFAEINFFFNFFQEHYQNVNCLDPNQDLRFVLAQTVWIVFLKEKNQTTSKA